MKRFLPLLALCALVLPALQPAQADDVSVDLFYNNLNGGNWYQVADYGYVWQPDVATDPNWRPYTDGYWAYTDQGWTWVSYEDFGWATYHYGRWARLADYGWVWVPGTEWAPAWVSWRTGGDYVGWAPLPPAGGEVVYESTPITGHVDVEFGIGPAFYNFIDLRYIGEPVLRDRILAPDQNVTIINNTVNVTNITYNNSAVYNYGPDYATVSRYSVRPIQRLKLERENVNPMQAIQNGSVTKVQGNQLLVAAPMKLQKAAAGVAPKQVKATIQQPKVEKGWAGINPAEKAKLEQSFKTQNAKNIPKPNIQPANANPAAAAAAASAAPGTNAAATQGNRGGKGRARAGQAEASVAPATSPVTANEGAQQGKGKNRGAQNDRNAVSPVPNRSPSVNAEGANPNRERPENAGQHKGNKREQNAGPAATPSPNMGAQNERKELNRAARGENANAENARRNAEVRQNAQEQRAAPRETQERRETQTAPRPNAGGAQPAAPRGERAEPEARRQPAQERPERAQPQQQRPQTQRPETQRPEAQQREQGRPAPENRKEKKEGEKTPAPQ
ncbi:MAG: hypothetical protein JO354_05650 [Verrucomicrobia bacterium]|nr:hypothetical protein [Verrucomicrobiota bacterium]